MKAYFDKLKGTSLPPPKAGWQEIIWATVGSGVAMSLIGLLHARYIAATGWPLLIAPFGASAVLVFGAFRSPLAQPRNVIGGHVISALVGVTVYQLIGGGNEAITIGLAVSLAIGLMHMTGTLHPPGGATAFVAVAGGKSIYSLGYWYILNPCLAGSILMVLIALCVNNIPPRQRYPLFW
ncbi:MAG: HPP family protein [Proteobacteria bacterium]|nr:HPP family protein [Pseudomonadota bacterium]